MSSRPRIHPGVLVGFLGSAPSRLVKKLDEEPEPAHSPPVAQESREIVVPLYPNQSSAAAQAFLVAARLLAAGAAGAGAIIRADLSRAGPPPAGRLGMQGQPGS